MWSTSLTDRGEDGVVGCRVDMVRVLSPAEELHHAGVAMPAFSAALAAHVHDSYGIVADDALGSLGVTYEQRRAMVSDGVLVRMFDGVYRVASTPLSLEGRCLAICSADSRAVITGRAAGRLWGLRRMGTDDGIEVRVPHSANTLTAHGIRLRRCNAFGAVDVVARPDGIRVVSPPRLAFDLAAPLSDIDLESVIEQILDRRWCTVQTLYATGRRLCHRARPGSARFARVMASRPAWLKPVDSHLELVLFDALRRAGVGGLVRQHAIPLPAGWTIHADIAVPALRWAIPIDHVTWHGGRIDAQRDKQNDRQARLVGWQVDRVTDSDIDCRLVAVTAELLALHHSLACGPDHGRRRSVGSVECP